MALARRDLRGVSQRGNWRFAQDHALLFHAVFQPAIGEGALRAFEHASVEGWLLRFDDDDRLDLPSIVRAPDEGPLARE